MISTRVETKEPNQVSKHYTNRQDVHCSVQLAHGKPMHPWNSKWGSASSPTAAFSPLPAFQVPSSQLPVFSILQVGRKHKSHSPLKPQWTYQSLSLSWCTCPVASWGRGGEEAQSCYSSAKLSLQPVWTILLELPSLDLWGAREHPFPSLTKREKSKNHITVP